MKLIVVGDPHIDLEGKEAQFVDTAENMKMMVEHINLHHADADHCLMLGDLTNEGEVEAFERLKDLTKPLQVPLLLMLGNHDNRENFQSVFPDVPRDENGFVQYSIDLGETHRLIILDTLNAPPYVLPDRHVGVLCAERLEFLVKQLEAEGDRDVIIAMHHQPFRIGLPGMDSIRLANDLQFMELVKKYANVKMLMMGHNHRIISGVVEGVPFNCFKSIDAQTPLNFDALDPSGGIVEPPSYGILQISENSILVHHEEFSCSAKPSSDWEYTLQNVPMYEEVYGQLIAEMLPERKEQYDQERANSRK